MHDESIKEHNLEVVRLGVNVLSICITELSGIDNIGLGIELELPSLELNCLKDFVPDSELNWNCYYRNWNCKNGIDPGSAEGAHVCQSLVFSV